MRQKRLILLSCGQPVDTMHGRIVEIVAVDAPNLVKYLPPFRARIDTNFNRRQRPGVVALGCAGLGGLVSGARAVHNAVIADDVLYFGGSDRRLYAVKLP